MSEELTREEWQAGELWAKFVAWVKGGAIAIALAVGMILLFAYVYTGYKSLKAEVAKIEAADVVQITPEAASDVLGPDTRPPVAKGKSNPKPATKAVANKPTNKPASAEFVPEVKAVIPILNGGFTSEFEKKLSDFERKIPK